MEKLKSLYVALGSVNDMGILENSLAIKKLNICLPYEPAIPLVESYPREKKTCAYEEV